MKKFHRFAAVTCALALTAVPVYAEETTQETVPYDIVYSTSNPIPEIAKNVRPAVVEVQVYQEKWDPLTRSASVDLVSGGSGCYIRASENGGYILTNHHVVESGDDFKIKWLDGTEMDVELKGTDDGTDIAVLEFKEAAPEGVQVIPMGSSDALEIGELAICIGNPGAGSRTLTSTVTAGIISGLSRTANGGNFTRSVEVIQTDAAINTGNSGGALLNARGELVGIPTLKLMYSSTVVYEGLGFCIPINTVKPLVEQIIETGTVVRPRMGMTVIATDGPEDAMRKFSPAGMKVETVEAGGPADKAGVKAGDIITELNGERVYSFLDMTVVLDKLSAGDSLKLKLYRYTYDTNGAIIGNYTEFETDVELAMID